MTSENNAAEEAHQPLHAGWYAFYIVTALLVGWFPGIIVSMLIHAVRAAVVEAPPSTATSVWIFGVSYIVGAIAIGAAFIKHGRTPTKAS